MKTLNSPRKAAVLMGDYKAIARIVRGDSGYTLFRRNFGPLAERAGEAQLDVLVGMMAETISIKTGKMVEIEFCADGAFLLTITEENAG